MTETGEHAADDSRRSLTEPGMLDPRAQRTVLVGMVALLSLGAFEALAVSTAMPVLAADLDGLPLYTYGFAATAVASLGGMLVAGRWADRAGPAAPLWTGTALFVAGVLVVGLAPSMEVVIGGRLLQGAGFGVMDVTLYVLVARIFPTARRPAVFAVFSAAWVVPALVGPLVAGLVTEHLGWRWVFLAVPVLAVPAVLWLRPGLAAAHAGAGGPDGSERDAGGGTASASPEDVALRAGDLVRSVLRVGAGLGAVVASRALVAGAFMGAEVLLPLALVHEHGLSPALAGTVLTLGAIGWSVGSWVRGHGLHGLTPTGWLRLGGTLLAAGILGAALLAVPSVPVAVGVVPWAVSGLGMGICYPTLSMLTLELAPARSRGLAMSALQVSEALATAAALSGTGALLWSLHDTWGLTAYAVCLALAGTLALTAAALAGRTRPPAHKALAPSTSPREADDENAAPARSS